MILICALLFLFIAVVILVLLSMKRLKNYRFSPFSLFLAICFLIAGIILTIFSSKEISAALIRQSWPVKSATIIETNIVGDRAYNPQVKCNYCVEENEYTLITDLNTPGFGRKRSRRQTAEIILKEFPVGSEVLIHYNPQNPGEALIRTGPYWSDYMKISLGVLLSTIGLYVLIGITIKRFRIR